MFIFGKSGLNIGYIRKSLIHVFQIKLFLLKIANGQFRYLFPHISMKKYHLFQREERPKPEIWTTWKPFWFKHGVLYSQVSYFHQWMWNGNYFTGPQHPNWIEAYKILILGKSTLILGITDAYSNNGSFGVIIRAEPALFDEIS